MNCKITTLFLFYMSLLVATASGEVQITPKIPLVGFLYPGAWSYGVTNIEAFRKGLRELGYVEGKNIDIRYFYAEGRNDRYIALARELVRLKVDAIVVAATPAIKAVKNATKAIPVVMAAAADPVGTGLIASLARPGANITGLSMRSPEISGKRLELIKEIVPHTNRVGILWNPQNPSNEKSLKESQAAAQSMGFQIESVKISDPRDFNIGLTFLINNRINAFTVFRDSLLLIHRAIILTFATKNNLPAVYDGREFALSGGLTSYTPNHLDLYRRAAFYLDKVLKGSKPADLPVEQTMRAEFIINLKAAEQIGLSIPSEVIQRADRVIK